MRNNILNRYLLVILLIVILPVKGNAWWETGKFYAEMQAHSTGDGIVYVDGTHESSDPGKTAPGAGTSKGAKYKDTYDPYFGGNTVTFNITATPDDGYEIDGWKEGDAPTDPWIEDAGSPIKTSTISRTVDVNSQKSDNEGTHALHYDIYAFFSVITYTLSFDKNGGSAEAPASFIYTIEDSPRTLPNYSGTKTAYTFDGWKPASNVGNWRTTELFTAGSSFSGKWGNATLNTHWTPTTYNVTYIPGDGASLSGSDNPQSYDIECSKTVYSASKTGATFLGWTVTSTESESNWTPGQTISAGTSLNGKYGDVTLTARWEGQNADIIISVSGLENGESAIFNVSKGGATLYTVALNPGNTSVTIKNQEIGSYTVTPAGWSWSYSLTPATSTQTIAAPNTTFSFSATRDTDAKKHDEKSNVNWRP